GEPQLLPYLGVAAELLWSNPPVYRKVELRRLEVLAHRQKIAPGVREVAHGCLDLVRPLAHPQDEVGLGHPVGAQSLGDPQYLERSVVSERGTDPGVEPPDRLQVVGEDVRLGLQDRGDGVLVASEVRGKDLDATSG